MQRRTLGKVGPVSALGFGCMRLPEHASGGLDEARAIALLQAGYANGITYFDTAHFYCNEQSQPVVGKAVKPFRDNILLATKLPLGESHDRRYFRETLEEQLRRLDTPYIDVYHFHGINRRKFDEVIMPNEMLADARRAQDEGLIRHMAFSFHDKPSEMSYIIERGELFASVLCQYNLLDRANEEEIQKAHERGLGVVVMGPVAGGRLGGASVFTEKAFDGKSYATPSLALRFVLSNPYVSCALSGMQNEAQLLENAETACDAVPLTATQAREVEASLAELSRLSELYCTGCGYCQPCPQDIEIAKLFRAYTMHNVYGLTENARRQFAGIAKKHPTGTAAGACVSCGLCVQKCPQKLDVPALLQRTAAALG